MVPADPEAERVILEAGFHSVGLDWQESLGDHKIRGDYSGMAGTSQQHSDINNILMMATIICMEYFYTFLLILLDQ